MQIDLAIRKVHQTLINCGFEVKTEKWQGINNPPQFWEALNVNMMAFMTEDKEKLAILTGANLPWAEDHFQERVAGKPVNPGEQYKNWPFYKRDKEMRTEGDKFTHTYMERFWPKRAGKPLDDMYRGSTNKGVRYEMGDLDDLINLLLKEPFTRQAYLPIWFPEDTGAVHGGRVPCTLGYYFIQRHGCLHMNYFIRSCDFFRHFRDDIYMAVRLAKYILDALRENSPDIWEGVRLGTLNMYIGSLHIFNQEVNLLKKHFINV